MKLWLKIGAFFAAVAAVAVAVWQAILYSKEERARMLAASTASLKRQADEEARRAKEEAEKKQREALKKLNAEVVRVDAHGDDLAGAFDRATGGRK